MSEQRSFTPTEIIEGTLMPERVSLEQDEFHILSKATATAIKSSDIDALETLVSRGLRLCSRIPTNQALLLTGIIDVAQAGIEKSSV